MWKVALLSLIVVFISALGVFVYWSTQNMREVGEYKKQEMWVHPYANANKFLIPGTRITVMSWNIAFGHGVGSDGKNYHPKSEEHYLNSLKAISTAILQEGVDIALIQEADIKSSRTYDVNQPKMISKMTRMPYIAPLNSWDIKYLPFPINNPFSRVKSGGAILSRYILKNHEQYLLPKGSLRTSIYNLFYPYRYFHSARLSQDEQILNLHFDAYDKENRIEQVNRLLNKINQDKPLIFGGDFNTIPIKGIEEEKLIFGKDDYRGDKCFSKLMAGLPKNYKEALSEDFVFLNTFPAHKPDRRLDYIFYDSDRLELVKAKVLVKFSNVSDHLPIIAQFIVR